MRIALIHHHYLQRGGEDAVFDAERDLLARRHEVVTYETSSRDLPRNPLRAAGLSLWNEDQRRRVRDFLRRERPEVVHVHNTFPLLSPAILRAADGLGLPLVQTLHNYRLLCVNGLLFRDGHVCEECVGRLPLPGVRHACYRGSRAGSAAVAAMLGLHRTAGTWDGVDTFVTLTEFAREKLAQGGLPRERMVVKPNFVTDPGVGRGGGGALFVGRLTPEKGVRTLLDAWRLVGGRLPLQIVGDGPLAGELAGGLPEGVTYLGPRAPEEVRARMGEASAVLVPSLWYEGALPLTVIEAFSTGTPVIASRLGAMPTLIEEERQGLLFEAGDPAALAGRVLQVLDRPELLDRMRVGARAAYEAHYTPEVNERMLMDVYTRAREGRARRQRGAA